MTSSNVLKSQHDVGPVNFRSSRFEKLQTGRFIWDFLSIWIPIGGAYLLSEKVSFWFYPLSLFIIAHRQVANALMGHEGAHGLLAQNRRFNDILARYLFHFPALISHSRYKSLHMLHHRFLGQKHDPDTFLYTGYPMRIGDFLKISLSRYFTGASVYFFANYFTELPKMIRRTLRIKYARDPHNIKSDFLGYCLFWTSALFVIHMTGFWREFLLYWIVPVILSIPWIQFQNALEHGALKLEAQEFSRSILTPYPLVALMLPKNLNCHLEHHLNPHVPHYRLQPFSKYILEGQLISSKEEFRVDLRQVLARLFSKSFPS